nr:Pr6Pr family membrane protein [Microbacterium pseudoresistens]
MRSGRAQRSSSTLIWGSARLFAAVLILAAIVTQLSLSIRNALAATTPHASHLPTVLANFFSYFTILSNVFAIVALAIGGIWMLARARDARPEPRWLGVLMACVATYMITTGIVYNLLLRGISQVGISAPWVNEVLHVVGPLILLLDVLFAPARRRLGWPTVLTIAAVPIVWAVYTLLRANLIVSPVTGTPWWYPYPFLDPHQVPGGYLGVAGYIAGIAAAILAIGAGVVALSRRARR